jgi:hypothetical protein
MACFTHSIGKKKIVLLLDIKSVCGLTAAGIDDQLAMFASAINLAPFQVVVEPKAEAGI